MNPLAESPASISIQSIWQAKKSIAPFIKTTPLIYSANLSRLLEAEVYLKPECFQITGSFKVRGACNKVISLSKEERSRGLVTCSSGNHGAALSYAASLVDSPPPIIYVPEDAETTKLKRIRSYGAEVRAQGRNFLETYEIAQEDVRSSGAEYIHSHGDPKVISGQGTIGLELMAELPDLDTVIVPVGGGGLISGIATAVKSGAPDAQIYGVEAAAAPGAYLSFQDGKCHENVKIHPSLADGLLGTLTPLTYAIASEFVSGIEIVNEASIAYAMQVLLEQEQIIAEGSAAVGLAAALEGKIQIKDRRVVFILTGRNISKDKYLKTVAPDNQHPFS